MHTRHQASGTAAKAEAIDTAIARHALFSPVAGATARLQDQFPDSVECEYSAAFRHRPPGIWCAIQARARRNTQLDAASNRTRP